MRSDVIGDFQEPYGAVFAVFVAMDRHLFPSALRGVIAPSERCVRTQIQLLRLRFAAMESAMHSLSIKTVWWWAS